MRKWIWSDLHLGHDNVIDYENRPFKDSREMNMHFLNVSRVVKKQETIFNLGDVCFKMNKEEVRKIITNMPGYKVLILGNHDKSKSVHWWEDAGFNMPAKEIPFL